MKLTKYFYKYSLRCVLVVVVTIASVILIVSGNSIGYINSLMIFAGFSICGFVVILIELLSILVISTYKSHRKKADTNVDHCTIDEIINFDDPTLSKNERLQQALDHFLLKSKLENIARLSAEQRARIRTKKTYIVRYADLMMDLFMFAVYLTILTLIVLSSRDSFAFYSTRATVRQFFMNRRYFKNETREPIQNDLFLGYLQNDFLPTIHTGKTVGHRCDF